MKSSFLVEWKTINNGNIYLEPGTEEEAILLLKTLKSSDQTIEVKLTLTYYSE